jgi:DNA-binding NarL/FixJ family response regulator
LAGEEHHGLAYFQRAHAAATSWPQQRESLVGIYFAASELDEPAAAAALASLQVTDDTSPDGILRLEVLRLTRAGRTGGIGAALDEARPKAHLLERAEEPLGITAFLHMLATASNLAADYAEADEYARKLLAVAAEYRLNLPEIHAHLNQAISALGRRAFQRAASELDHVRKRIPRTGDAYLEPTIRVITCRSLLMRQRFEEAVELTQDRADAISSLPFRAEYLSCRALACACVGDFREGGQLLDDAEANYPASVELRVLRACVDAAIARRDEVQRGESALAVWRAAAETGNYDSLVCAYRADPELLGDLRAVNAEADTLLARANDASLARKYGFKTMVSERLSPLTARETEVLRELEQGVSNREIAERLFVSESTVKAHLRHIYEKLGVKGRTELLARRVRQR